MMNNRGYLVRFACRWYSQMTPKGNFSNIDIDIDRHAVLQQQNIGTSTDNSSTDLKNDPEMSQFRTSNGEPMRGSNASEARLHEWTLQGRQSRSITKLPEEIARVINQSILPKHPPAHLRARAALIFQSLSKDQIQKAPEDNLDCDAHIAALFLQDYTNIKQVLTELQNRIGKDNFNPRLVLDIGYGPATGMVALNEIMGEDWIPEVKESYVIGRTDYMKRQAKIILLRQANENVVEVDGYKHDRRGQNEDKRGQNQDQEGLKEFEEEKKDRESSEVTPFEYKQVDVSKINTHTKFRDHLPLAGEYDLIIVNQCLLKRVHLFPRDVDLNVHNIVKLLSPGGRIAFVERGNALGFETIARARQVMIRPEDFESERGKIARPYFKASTIKPQRLKSQDLIITERDLEFERELLEKYGEVDEEDLKFEFEDSGEYEMIDPKAQNSESVGSAMTKNDDSSDSLDSSEGLAIPEADFHLKILAPCPHHSKCPLQLGDPNMYKIPKYRNRLHFCSFHKTTERPKYTLELKKGKQLATKWDLTLEDGFGLEKIAKSKRQELEGTGRRGGHDFETGSYSYMIAERLLNDIESIKKIQEERMYQSEQLDASLIDNWPRILKQPNKQKKNVKIEVCAPSGKLELWDISKSLGKQEYHDARKAIRGDLWALGKKTAHVRHGMSESKAARLRADSKKSKKKAQKEERKRNLKLLIKAQKAHDIETGDDPQLAFMVVADQIATELEMSGKYRQQGKRANFTVDPRDHDGL